MPGLDDMMAELRNQAGSVRGTFDVGALAAAGRRRARRRRAALGGALAAVSVVVLGGGVWGLTTWAGQQPPQTVADTKGTGASVPASEEIAPVQVTVDTSGWLTFSSPEYPVTFQYPPSWTIWGEEDPLDGCTTINCVTIVSPPAFLSSDTPPVDGTAPVELIRNGFADDYAVRLPGETEVLGSVPGLTGWGLDQDGPGQVVVVRSQDEWGVDYSLAAAGSTVNSLALGDQNPSPDRTETAFSFATNVGNVGGETGGEHTQTLVAILASVQPNPGFAPTQPQDDGTGRQVAAYDAMSTPTVGAVAPDSSWKTYTSHAGKVTVRYPSTWTVDDSMADSGIVWIVAPSGYIIDLLTNGSGGHWCTKDHGPSEVLGTLEDRVWRWSDAYPSGVPGLPAQIRWTNGGEFPVWVGLTLEDPAQPDCYGSNLKIIGGGTTEVYLGSADNRANPTPEELDQAVAILASVRPAG